MLSLKDEEQGKGDFSILIRPKGNKEGESKYRELRKKM
jgi:hypothetical protein